MRKTLVVVAFLILSSLYCPAARADEENLPIGIVGGLLQLSEDQTIALITMVTTRHATVRPIAENLQAIQRQLALILESPGADPAEAGRLLIQLHEGQKQIQTISQELAASFAATLNADQRHQLEFLRQAEKACSVIPAFKAVGLL